MHAVVVAHRYHPHKRYGCSCMTLSGDVNGRSGAAQCFWDVSALPLSELYPVIPTYIMRLSMD